MFYRNNSVPTFHSSTDFNQHQVLFSYQKATKQFNVASGRYQRTIRINIIITLKLRTKNRLWYTLKALQKWIIYNKPKTSVTKSHSAEIVT